MALAIARVAMPATARKGDVIEIKALMRHVMEPGYRVDNRGQIIPRDIVKSLSVMYAGAEVFRMDMHPAVAANPFVVFSTVAVETGELVFTWVDEKGAATVEKKLLTVTE